MSSRLTIPVVALLALGGEANWFSDALAQGAKPAAVSPQVPTPRTPSLAQTMGRGRRGSTNKMRDLNTSRISSGGTQLSLEAAANHFRSDDKAASQIKPPAERFEDLARPIRFMGEVFDPNGASQMRLRLIKRTRGRHRTPRQQRLHEKEAIIARYRILRTEIRKKVAAIEELMKETGKSRGRLYGIVGPDKRTSGPREEPTRQRANGRSRSPHQEPAWFGEGGEKSRPLR